MMYTGFCRKVKMNNIEIVKIKLDFLDTNCYMVYGNGIDFLIDPGSDSEKIIRYLGKREKGPDFVIGTHCHFDHIGAAGEIAGYYNIPVYIHQNEEEILNNPDKNLSSFFNVNTLLLKTYKILYGVETKDFLSKEIDIMTTPGHTPGSIIIRYDRYLFTGDLLFKDSVGRTDLPGGDPAKMKTSLSLLKTLDKNLIVLPGHGAETTLEDELKNNYFLNSRDSEDFN